MAIYRNGGQESTSIPPYHKVTALRMGRISEMEYRSFHGANHV